MDIIQSIIIIFIALFVINRFLPIKGITNISVEEVKNKFKAIMSNSGVRTPEEYKGNIVHHQKYTSFQFTWKIR